MKTIKVAEATELQLDWLVAKCLGEHEDETLDPLTWLYTAKPTGCWDFCTNWALGGPSGVKASALASTTSNRSCGKRISGYLRSTTSQKPTAIATQLLG